jgi:hypothetical protein
MLNGAHGPFIFLNRAVYCHPAGAAKWQGAFGRSVDGAEKNFRRSHIL